MISSGKKTVVAFGATGLFCNYSSYNYMNFIVTKKVIVFSVLLMLITSLYAPQTHADSHLPLQLGSYSDAVKVLQIALNADPETQVAESGPGSVGKETTFFGPRTVAALKKYQSKHGGDLSLLGSSNFSSMSDAPNELTAASDVVCINRYATTTFVTTTALATGTKLVTTMTYRIRGDKGTSSNYSATVATGTRGTVIESDVQIGDGYHWFKVNYSSGVIGWNIGGVLQSNTKTQVGCKAEPLPLPKPKATSTVVVTSPAMLPVVLFSSEIPESDWVTCAKEGEICKGVTDTTLKVRYVLSSTTVYTHEGKGPQEGYCQFHNFLNPPVNLYWNNGTEEKIYQAMKVPFPTGYCQIPKPSSVPSKTLSTTWVTCGSNGATCKMTGTHQVRFGWRSDYITKSLSGNFTCNQATFGDYGYWYKEKTDVKTCQILQEATATVPSGVASDSALVSTFAKGQICDQNHPCPFTTGKDIMKGNNGTFAVSKVWTNPNATWNPWYSSYETLSLRFAPEATIKSATSSKWTSCASFGGYCTLATPQEVRYGEATYDTVALAKVMSGKIACTSESFVPNLVWGKASCYVKQY
jgi:peptidoglycan hydrolase-like protein with peptidoglycan-binding domain